MNIYKLNVFSKFFIWCAGSSTDILRTTPQSEYIKHIGFGTLVIIPSIIAFISSSYAISTLTDDEIVYLSVGLIWSMIVFSFDRFIVSTFRKEDSMLKDFCSFRFISRIIFAFFIGIVVSHPLVMFIFEESISEQLNQMRQERINKIYDTKILDIKEEIKRINSELEENKKVIRETQVLLTKEMTGTGGSEIPGVGPVSEGLKEQIRKLSNNIEEQNLIKDKLHRQIDELDTKREQTIEDETKFNFSKDYLARATALGHFIQQNTIVMFTYYTLLIFFIIIDILPVTFKAFTTKEPYDYKLQNSNRKVIDKSISEYNCFQELIKKIEELRINKIKDLDSDDRFEKIVNYNTLIKDFEFIISESILSYKQSTHSKHSNLKTKNTIYDSTIVSQNFNSLTMMNLTILLVLLFILWFYIGYLIVNSKQIAAIITMTSSLVTILSVPLSNYFMLFFNKNDVKNDTNSKELNSQESNEEDKEKYNE